MDKLQELIFSIEEQKHSIQTLKGLIEASRNGIQLRDINGYNNVVLKGVELDLIITTVQHIVDMRESKLEPLTLKIKELEELL